MSRIHHVKEFTINRRRWLHGEGADRSRLYRQSDQKQCCVGIYLSACGLSRSALIAPRVAEEVNPPVLRAQIPKWLIGEDGHDIYDLYHANDDSLKEAYRERRIRGIFKRHGITVRFVGRATLRRRAAGGRA